MTQTTTTNAQATNNAQTQQVVLTQEQLNNLLQQAAAKGAVSMQQSAPVQAKPVVLTQDQLDAMLQQAAVQGAAEALKNEEESSDDKKDFWDSGWGIATKIVGGVGVGAVAIMGLGWCCNKYIAPKSEPSYVYVDDSGNMIESIEI